MEPFQWKTAKERTPDIGCGGLEFFGADSLGSEYIHVEVELQNPLHIPLQFTQMQLVATHTPLKESEEGNSEKEAYTVTPFDLLLAPSESKKVVNITIIE